MQTLTVSDGTTLAYAVDGEGPPVILVHGGSLANYWEPLVPGLAEAFRTYRPHRRGHGESEAGPPADDAADALEREVEDLVALIDAVEGRPALVGVSYGALLALAAAQRRPVASLVVYEPSILVGDHRETADLADRVQARIDDGDPEGAARTYVADVLYEGPEEELDAWLAEWPPWPAIVDDVDRHAETLRAVESYELPATLEVDAPTLVLSGEDSPVQFREAADAVVDRLADATRRRCSDIGHGGPAADPERFVPIITEFLRTQHERPDD